jgi:hypothetical protein
MARYRITDRRCDDLCAGNVVFFPEVSFVSRDQFLKGNAEIDLIDPTQEQNYAGRYQAGISLVSSRPSISRL